MLWDREGVDSGPIEVLTERWARRQQRPNVKVHETKQLIRLDRAAVDGIPCTSVVRTLLDNAGVLHPFRTDQMLEDAVRKRVCTLEEVAERFIQFARRGRRGTRTMRRLLAKRIGRDVPTMSEFERRFLELVIASHIAMPELQYAVDLATCTVYLDFAWLASSVAAECDGLFQHGSDLRLPWDDDRQNELVLRGWMILRFTWKQLTEQPNVVIRQLTEALADPSRQLAWLRRGFHGAATQVGRGGR
jgi:very-short-patch-repair endonuclease